MLTQTALEFNGTDCKSRYLIISNATISEALIAKGVDIATVAKQSQIVLANAIHENFDALLRALPELGSTLIDIDFTFLGINLSLTPSAGILNIYWFIPIISGVLSWLGVFINQKHSGSWRNSGSEPSAAEQDDDNDGTGYVYLVWIYVAGNNIDLLDIKLFVRRRAGCST